MREVDRKLFNAIKQGNLDRVKECLSRGADILTKDDSGKQPIHVAAITGNTDIIEFLLNSGASVDDTDKEGRTSLYHAAFFGNLEVVKFLVDKGASINAKDRFGWTPLHSATKSNSKSVSVVEFLVDNGADIDTRENNGRAPLHFASVLKTVNVTEFLVDIGANIGVQDNNGKTPFELAYKNDRTEIADFLATVQDIHHRTALHYAAQEENLKLVGLLIEKGADVNAKDNEGKTPLDLAKANHIEIVSLLEESMRKEKEEILSTDTRSRRSVEDDNIMIKNNQATSRGSKPSLWINGLFGWAKGSIGELFGFQAVVPEKLGNSREQSLPGISQHNKTVKTSNAGSFLNSENVALVVCMRDVLDALDDAPSKRYQKLTSQGIEVIPNTSVAVQFALKKFNSFVKDEISNLGSKEKDPIHELENYILVFYSGVLTWHEHRHLNRKWVENQVVCLIR